MKKKYDVTNIINFDIIAALIRKIITVITNLYAINWRRIKSVIISVIRKS